MRALFAAVCEYIFLEYLAREIGRAFKRPAVIHEDNSPVVTLCNREKAAPRNSKHFVMLVNYIRELVEDGKLEVQHIPTRLNFADILTKHVYGRDFAYKVQQVLGLQEGEQLLEPVAAPERKGD